ncbi:MAG: hypothetical protein RSB74_06130, partial [Kiritimatiellia bacterium]
MGESSHRPTAAKEFLRFNRNSWRWIRFWVPAEDETVRMGRSVLICALVGVAVGLMSIWFFTMIEWVRALTIESFGQYAPPLAEGELAVAHHLEIRYTLLDRLWPGLGAVFAGFMRFILPGLGALLACLIARRFAPSAS